ncbi:MAG: DUF1830 domain-containing protein [Oscillatoriales cyanobacterium RM2_1_1]|nr:DUF1830 domain-containing protein [Oscillatoriales cyanobacterium SM2_3_0]NJO47112.1 DUF1830 domain-containing protein [Oscillatoriales cyanobacterium RM2_1_1]
MTLLLDRLPQGYSNKILCCYFNQTQKVQIVRIINIENWYFERVVFSGERLMFEAPLSAELEVYQANETGIALLEVQGCDRLQVDEGDQEFEVII